MTRILPAAVLCAGLFALATPIIGSAQTTPSAQPPAPPMYRPGLGDLMTMTVQPRHIKLALAGREKNWPYAAYELHQLEESLERGGALLAAMAAISYCGHDRLRYQGADGDAFPGDQERRRRRVQSRL